MNRLTAITTIFATAAGIRSASGQAKAKQKPKPAAHPVTAAKPPQPEEAVIAKIEKFGGTVSPLAQNDPRLEVDYHMQGASVTDAALVPLAGLKNVVHLHLGKTSVTDAGLAHVKPLTKLTELHLEETKITDKGLAYVKDLRDLTYLNLYGTAVTDAGLGQLTGLTNLKNLYLWQSKVTEAGVESLKKLLPKLQVVTGWDTAPAKPPAATAPPAPAKK